MKKTLALTLLLSISAQAKFISAIPKLKNLRHKQQKAIQGDWGSGGGNVIACFDNKTSYKNTLKNKFVADEDLKSITSLEMYDLWKARTKRVLGGEYNYIIPFDETNDKNEWGYYEKVLSRGLQVSAHTIGLLFAQKYLVKEHSIFTVPGPVKQINDIGDVAGISQKNCTITTMAAQQMWKSNNDHHFEINIDERLYFHPKHSNVSKSVLILHEVVYAIGRAFFKHKTSANTRSVVELLISHNKNIIAKRVIDEINKLFWSGLTEDQESHEKYQLSMLHLQLNSRIESILKEAAWYWNDHYLDQKSEYIDNARKKLEYVLKRLRRKLSRTLKYANGYRDIANSLWYEHEEGEIKLTKKMRMYVDEVSDGYTKLFEQVKPDFSSKVKDIIQDIYQEEDLKSQVKMSENDALVVIQIKERLHDFILEMVIDSELFDHSETKYGANDLELFADMSENEYDDSEEYEYYKQFGSIDGFIFDYFTLTTDIDVEIGDQKSIKLDLVYPLPPKNPGKMIQSDFFQKQYKKLMSILNK